VRIAFRCPIPELGACRARIRAIFKTHECKPLDASQNALRVVRGATENE
jgi:hypothetical protein